MPERLHIDIETYSSVDIKKSGVYKYCRSIDFEILLVAYSFDDNAIQIIDIAGGEELPQEFIEALHNTDIKKLAHNAAFERQCFEQAGYQTPIDVWYCTAIKSSYCGLPLALAKVSEALELGQEGKMSTGKALIRYFCIPCKPTKTNGGRTRNLPEHNPQKWEAMKLYCKGDVRAERKIHHSLSTYTIPAFERRNYILDQEINDRGVLVDTVFVKSAIALDKHYTGGLTRRAIKLTGLENPNSLTKLKGWLSEAMQKEITTLAKTELKSLIGEASGAALEVLQLRQKLSKSSIRKYTAMLFCADDDLRARGVFQFYGAHTGRWAGRRIQPQNMPQNHLELLELTRKLVRAMDWETLELMYEDLSAVLSQLIRTALVAKEGHTFAVADFSAIEARVIAWLAGETWRLDVFNSHGKIYEASAAKMFNVPIETVTKGSDLRKKGKVAELALGFGGGVEALRTMGAERMGLLDVEMQNIVDKWRKASPSIKKLWHAVEGCAIRALKTRKTIVSKCGRLVYKYDGRVLRIKLPSGRCLFYYAPKIGKSRYGSDCMKYRTSINGKWVYKETWGGTLVENIVQAIARDLLAFSMRSLDKAGFKIAMHVHDEAACEVPMQGQTDYLKQMFTIMATAPEWAEGLPLGADGYLTPFYKKD